MLRKIEISNFKCFQELEVSLKPLTLLSGLNGGGKSSVLQALVLLSQTMNEREWGKGLLLEGPDLALGTFSDILNRRASSKKIKIGLSSDKEQIVWTFSAEDRRSTIATLIGVSKDGKTLKLQRSRLGKTQDKEIRFLLPDYEYLTSGVIASVRNLDWISAERLGPREILPLHDLESHLKVGHYGELAAGSLFWRSMDEVDEARCVPGTPATLQNQVRERMREFFPGSDLAVSPVDGASAVTLRLRSNPNDDFHRPQNVGFGLTQLLPIIVSLLSAKRGSLILIENPEIHLHPRAQQEIGSFIALVASSGVQVIVETHSDHVLNGIRLSVKKGVIQNQDIAIHFFSPSLGEGDGDVSHISPEMDKDGRIDAWPEGFFDQFDIALSRLL